MTSPLFKKPAGYFAGKKALFFTKRSHLPISCSATRTPTPASWLGTRRQGCSRIANSAITQAINYLPGKAAARASQCSWNVWKYLSKHDSGFIVSSINMQTFPLLIKGIETRNILKSIPTCLLSNFLCNCHFPHRKCFSPNDE